MPTLPFNKTKYLAGLAEGKSPAMAAKACGVNYHTVYRRRRRDPDFAAEEEAVRADYENDVSDTAESLLAQAVRAGERWAIMEWLTRRRPHKWGKPALEGAVAESVADAVIEKMRESEALIQAQKAQEDESNA